VEGGWYLSLIAKDGMPTTENSVVINWLKGSTSGHVLRESVTQHLRCGFCWGGVHEDAAVTEHTSARCSLLTTFCNVRGHGKFIPITMGHNSVEADPERQRATVEDVQKEMVKEVKGLRSLISALDRRVAVMESERAEKARDHGPGTSNPERPRKKSKPNGTVANIVEIAEEGSEDPPRRVLKKGKGRDGRKANS
jgi:hypothetical protein